MRKIRETIIVEGRYDVNTLKQCVDAHVIETSGFGVFNDEEKRKLIQLLASGVIPSTIPRPGYALVESFSFKQPTS